MSLLWKIGGIGIALFAAYLLVTMYGKARYERGVADQKVADAAAQVTATKQVASAEVAGWKRVADAQSADADRWATRQPVIVRSTDTVRDYAKTADGAVLCLSGDRVRGIEGDRAALFPVDPAAAGQRPGAVSADAAPKGR